MERKFLSGAVVADPTLNERQIRVVASTGNVDRMGDVLVPDGCDLTGFRSNPIVLADHDPSSPIGNAGVAVQNGRVEAMITFAPAGISAKADEYCGLAKSGVLRAVSVGFNPVEAEPRRSADGQRIGITYKKWQLLELSMVAVPANGDAVVIGRSHGKSGRVLSGANAEKLRAAHDHAENARAAIADVLDSADAGDEGKAKRQREVEIFKLGAPLSEADMGFLARKGEIETLSPVPDAAPSKRLREIRQLSGGPNAR